MPGPDSHEGLTAAIPIDNATAAVAWMAWRESNAPTLLRKFYAITGGWSGSCLLKDGTERDEEKQDQDALGPL